MTSNFEAQSRMPRPELSLLAPGMPDKVGEIAGYNLFHVKASADGESCTVSHIEKLDQVPGGFRTVAEVTLSGDEVKSANEWIANASQNLNKRTNARQFHQLDVAGDIVTSAGREIDTAKGRQPTPITH